MAGRGNFTKVLAVAGLGGGAYYLYQAGGNPKVAEKKLEHDAARVGSSVGLTGREKEAKTELKVLGEEAGAKIDSAFNTTKAKANELDSTVSKYATDAEKRFESARKDAGKEINTAIDRFDKSVEKGASQVSNQVSQTAEKAKSSSWFGFGGK